MEKIEKKIKIILAIVSIPLGVFFTYNGWQKKGIYLVTELFCGSVMFFFGIALLFFLNNKKKKKLEYKDIYIKNEGSDNNQT